MRVIIVLALLLCLIGCDEVQKDEKTGKLYKMRYEVTLYSGGKVVGQWLAPSCELQYERTSLVFTTDDGVKHWLYGAWHVKHIRVPVTAERN